MIQPHLVLELLESRLSVCRLEPGEALPSWAFTEGPLCSVTRTREELSVVCKEKAVPPGIRCERDWRALKVEGPLDFALTGILVALAAPLAEAGISIFAISTYDTDYLMVREPSLDKALETLIKSGHSIKLPHC